MTGKIDYAIGGHRAGDHRIASTKWGTTFLPEVAHFLQGRPEIEVRYTKASAGAGLAAVRSTGLFPHLRDQKTLCWHARTADLNQALGQHNASVEATVFCISTGTQIITLWGHVDVERAPAGNREPVQSVNDMELVSFHMSCWEMAAIAATDFDAADAVVVNQARNRRVGREVAMMASSQ